MWAWYFLNSKILVKRPVKARYALMALVCLKGSRPVNSFTQSLRITCFGWCLALGGFDIVWYIDWGLASGYLGC